MTFLIKHFDTIDSIYTIDSPFDTTFNLQYPLRKVKKIYLKSFEIPIDFTNIRNGLNTFSILYNSVVYTKTLSDKNYISITTLCNDLNTLFTNCISNITILFSSNSNTNLISISLTGSSPLTFTIVPTNLSNHILGFKKSSNLQNLNTYTITGSNPFLLSVDNYIVMNFPKLAFDNNNNSHKLCNFKIPLNASNGMVYFENEFSNLSQHIINTDNSLIISSLKIQILDRFNNILTQSNSDFSFTLGFEIEN
jgi:hypothetical protein